MIHTSSPQDIIDEIDKGSSVFITGSAGSGKTYLASQLASNTKRKTALTATTGIAALNLGGDTIHRFLGIGIACRQFEADKVIGRWRKISKSQYSSDQDRWKMIQSVETIIIDEVSMLRSDQFELMDTVLSAVRDNYAPFGGVQMVLVGDFFQLPPVVPTRDLKRYADLKRPFAFQSDVWEHANIKSFNLKTNYRQGAGDFLNALLEKIRVGKVDSDTGDLFSSRVDAKLNTKLEPIRIFPHRKSAHEENMSRLSKLPASKLVSEAEYTGREYDAKSLEKECPAEDKLYFCLDAQMMLTNDVKGRWVNGSMGTIEAVDADGNPTIRLDDGSMIQAEYHTWERIRHIVKDGKVETKTLSTMKQYPFKLSYGTTIHKSQGLTLDYVDMDLSNCFVHGQAYVALSRARDIDGITLRGWSPNKISANPEVLKFYNI